MTLSHEQIDRFRSEVARLTGAERVGLAISGGPDSMALLHLAVAALPGRIEAATVDHGLRPEAVTETAFVGRACGALGIAHSVLTVSVTREASLQAAARRARYEALAAWCRKRSLAALATAHHADDQAETLLMRLARGAGLPGLTGIRTARDLGGVMLIRPLLGWRRSELAAIVAGIATVDDPSNADLRHDRARMRALLAAAGKDIDPRRMAASAAHLAEADAALAWVVGEAIRSRVERTGGRMIADLEGLPREIRRRILVRLIGESDSVVDGPTLDTAMQRLEAGQHASLGGLKLSPGNRILIENAPRRRRKRGA